MIRVFVTDIDGCLSVPYQPFRLGELSELRTLARRAGSPNSGTGLPAVSICSGRAYPYVEAMSQLLDLSTPVLFESGAGLFDPVRMHCSWHPGLTESLVREMEDVKIFVSKLTKGTDISVDLAKRSQVAVVAPDKPTIDGIYDDIRVFIENSHPTFRTFITPFSVDVVAPNLTKREGITWLADLLEIELENFAFVGDTDGDIGALTLVGYSFAPANADTSVKGIVDTVTEGFTVDGVLEAYGKVVKINGQANRPAS